MRTYRTLSFDQDVERYTLKRIEPSLQIAFPALLDTDQKLKRGVFGRHLDGICARPDERYPAEWVHAAWEEAVTLEAVLEAQSDRAFWDREFAGPTVVGSPGSGKTRESVRQVTEAVEATAVGLVAPGTDMAATLAELRGAMLREVREAIKLLADAKRVVGPIPTDDEDED